MHFTIFENLTIFVEQLNQVFKTWFQWCNHEELDELPQRLMHFIFVTGIII